MDGKKFEFALIEAVKHNDCIYNKALKSYRNKLLKEKAWRDVSGCVGAEIKQCQERWKSLRDRFVKESVRRRKSGSGAAEKDSAWVYYQALSFLRIHVAPRSTVSNKKFGKCSGTDSSPSSLSTEPTDGSPEPPLSAGELFQTPEPRLSLGELFQTPESLLATEVVCTPESPIFLQASTSSDVDTPSSSSRKRKAEEKFSRLDSIIDSVHSMISGESGRNAGYYAVLETYMKQLPEIDQDTLKSAFLAQVNEKIQRLN